MNTKSHRNSAAGEVVSSAKVEGAAVYDVFGTKLGSIDDLVIDRSSGQVRYAILEFGGFLGMGMDRYPIPWTALKYSTERGGYVVPLDKAALERAPTPGERSAPVYTRIGRYYENY